MKLNFILRICILILGISSGNILSARTIHVPQDCQTIQEALDFATNGDTVLVASGIYKGDGNRDIDFYGKAVVLVSEHGLVSTLIDCQGSEYSAHRGFHFHSQEDSTSIIRGFTVKHGNMSNQKYPENCGGGISCENASPSIINCIIFRNTADYGGGLSSIDSSPRLAFCEFSDSSQHCKRF
jgi:hypothetical protein